MADYEEFDVTGGLEEGFENLDVTQEPQAEAAVSLAALGSLTEREEELRAVSQARDEFEQRFLIDPGQRAFDAAEESPAGLGNIVGVGIGEKEVEWHSYRSTGGEGVRERKTRGHTGRLRGPGPFLCRGVATDVDVTGEIHAQMFTARYRPAPGGVSIGRCDIVHAGHWGVSSDVRINSLS